MDLDYRKVQKLNYNHMRYNSNYALALFGPIGHSAKDKGKYSRIIMAMEQVDGYPPVMRLCQNDLKITKTNFQEMLTEAIRGEIIETDRSVA